MVLSRNELTGATGYKPVTAQYSNPYEETVYVRVRDGVSGVEQEIVSNRIHPFFVAVSGGRMLPRSSEGHDYKGEIEGGAWVDADSASVVAGRNLTVETLQDLAQSRSSSVGASVTFTGTAVTGGSANVSGASSDYRFANTVSGIFTNGALDITVGGVTELIGATLNSGQGLLNLDTGALITRDLTDVDRSRSFSAGISYSSGGRTLAPAYRNAAGAPCEAGTAGCEFAWNATVSGSYARDILEGRTLATIGQGSVTVRNQTDEQTSLQLAGLNRDASTNQIITRDDSFRTGNLELDVGALARAGENLASIRATLERRRAEQAAREVISTTSETAVESQAAMDNILSQLDGQYNEEQSKVIEDTLQSLAAELPLLSEAELATRLRNELEARGIRDSSAIIAVLTAATAEAKAFLAKVNADFDSLLARGIAFHLLLEKITDIKLGIVDGHWMDVVPAYGTIVPVRDLKVPEGYEVLSYNSDGTVTLKMPGNSLAVSVVISEQDYRRLEGIPPASMALVAAQIRNDHLQGQTAGAAGAGLSVPLVIYGGALVVPQIANTITAARVYILGKTVPLTGGAVTIAEIGLGDATVGANLGTVLSAAAPHIGRLATASGGVGAFVMVVKGQIIAIYDEATGAIFNRVDGAIDSMGRPVFTSSDGRLQTIDSSGLPVAPTGTVVRVAGTTCGCFVAGTQVLTPDGLVEIQSLDIGDIVIARHEVTGELAPQPITALIRPPSRRIWNLSVADDDGEVALFQTTDDHPWHVSDENKFVPTRELNAGMELSTKDGRGVTIRSLEVSNFSAPTFNLTVANAHTFFVGEDGVWVHNSNPCRFNQAVVDAGNPTVVGKNSDGRELLEFTDADGVVRTVIKDARSDDFIVIPSQRQADIDARTAARDAIVDQYTTSIVVDIGGGGKAALNKEGLNNILLRHHRDYFSGRVTEIQDFFPDGFTVSDIENIVRAARRGLLSQSEVKVSYRGKIYEVGYGTDGVIRHVTPLGGR